jgi:hypothetical protein
MTKFRSGWTSRSSIDRANQGRFRSSEWLRFKNPILAAQLGASRCLGEHLGLSLVNVYIQAAQSFVEE